jgi:hypothetical protein
MAVFKFMGNKCWQCDESIGEISRYILCFHHVYPKDKLFGLTADNMARSSMLKLKKELRKCVCLCANCHNKFHYTDLISQEEIEYIYDNFWSDKKEIDLIL